VSVYVCFFLRVCSVRKIFAARHQDDLTLVQCLRIYYSAFLGGTGVCVVRPPKSSLCR